ncbi:hypothetical protein [Aquimarina sp. 2304DJ70-9]|uniref:hypothetical protein n=1 Tax=Aquimarina penaris TaxID=3231044 RepID=UPI003462D0B2
MILRRACIFTFILTLLSSCDPAKKLIINNKTTNEISLKIVSDTENRLPVVSETDTHDYFLRQSGKDSKALFIYKMGTWGKQELDSIRETIVEVKVFTLTDTLSYKTQAELASIVSIKRKGLLKSVLKVVIK